MWKQSSLLPFEDFLLLTHITVYSSLQVQIDKLTATFNKHIKLFGSLARLNILLPILKIVNTSLSSMLIVLYDDGLDSKVRKSNS